MIHQGKPISSISFKKIEEIKSIFGKYEEVLTAYLFGSTATGKKTRLSDIDIAVLLSNMKVKDEFYFIIKLKEEISKIIENDDFDLLILNKVPVVLRYQVLKNGKILYSKDEKARVEFEESTRGIYFDFAPVRNEYYRIFFENIESGRMLSDR